MRVTGSSLVTGSGFSANGSGLTFGSGGLMRSLRFHDGGGLSDGTNFIIE